MVYNGKPSTGCGRCKERRKKCDETKPYCLNCQKIGKQCPGFPNELDLMFKNETDSVTRKANRISKKTKLIKRDTNDDSLSRSKTLSDSENDANVDPALKNPPSKKAKPTTQKDIAHASATEPKSDDDDLFWNEGWDPAASLTFNPSIEAQATSFFFEHFVLKPRSKQNSPSRRFLDILIPMFHKTASSSPLAMATEALAMRTASNFHKGKHLLPQAEALYGQALRAAQVAIQTSAESATSDETLLTILLFSLYESITSSNGENWSKHIQGAVSIVRSRGVSQFSNHNSMLLFRATRTQMLTDAIQRCEAIKDFPARNGWLSDQEYDSSDTGAIPSKTSCLIEHSIRLPNVLAKAKRLLSDLDSNTDSNATTTTVEEVYDLLQDAYNLQHELFEWDMNIPPQFCPRTPLHHSTPLSEEETETSEIWKPGGVHVYPDVQVASLRNNNRVSQLLCCGVVVDAMRWLAPENYMEDRRYKAAAYKIQYLVDDIAASVPYFLGYRETPAEKNQPEGPVKNARRGTGAYYVIWPLLISSTLPPNTIPDQQRRWLKAKLAFIAKKFHLQPADLARSRAGGSWNLPDEGEPEGMKRQSTSPVPNAPDSQQTMSLPTFLSSSSDVAQNHLLCASPSNIQIGIEDKCAQQAATMESYSQRESALTLQYEF